MTIKEKRTIEFDGCYGTDEYYNKVAEIMADMTKSDAPYSGSLELEVSLDSGNVSTGTKKAKGLSATATRMFDELEVLATAIAKRGKEPAKVKTEIDIEKEV